MVAMVEYCPQCGTRVNEDYFQSPDFCRECGAHLKEVVVLKSAQTVGSPNVRRATTPFHLDNGNNNKSILRCSLSGLRWLIVLNWIPIVGPFLAGYKAGSMAGSSARGLVSGFMVGIFSSALLAALISVLGALLGGLIIGLKGALAGFVISAAIAGTLLLLYSFYDIAACTFGGLVGGAVEAARLREKLGNLLASTSAERPIHTNRKIIARATVLASGVVENLVAASGLGRQSGPKSITLGGNNSGKSSWISRAAKTWVFLLVRRVLC